VFAAGVDFSSSSPDPEWGLAHRAELEANWMRAREGEPLERIAPLD
jgi:hypothetical protein